MPPYIDNEMYVIFLVMILSIFFKFAFGDQIPPNTNKLRGRTTGFRSFQGKIYRRSDPNPFRVGRWDEYVFFLVYIILFYKQLGS